MNPVTRHCMDGKYPDLPQPLKLGGGARIADTLYAGLGCAGRAWYRLDLAAPVPQWVGLAPFAGEVREQPVVAASGGCVYVFGGLGVAVEGGGLALLDDIHRYDPATDRWDRLTGRTPVGLLGAAVSTLSDGRIMLVGGCSKAVLDAHFARMDAAGDNAARKAEIARDYLEREPQAYHFNADVLCFDPATQDWCALGPLPFAPVVGAAVASTDRQVAVVHGELKPGLRSRDAWLACETANGALQWRSLPPLVEVAETSEQEGLAGAFAGYVAGALLVAGGTNFPGAWAQYRAGRLYAHEGLAKTWHGHVYALVGGEWEQVGRLSRGLAHGLAFAMPQGLLLVGGEEQGGVASAAVQYLHWDGVTAQCFGRGVTP